jgi:hypothetical protein
MSTDSSGPFQSDADRALQDSLRDSLRDALRDAAESVEPAADGLDRIRAKIIAPQPARARLARWRTAPGADGGAWRRRRPFQVAGVWLATASLAVVERFRPDPDRTSWLGWLRPAAAIATGLFVVTAASWAVAALPAALAPPARNWRHTPIPPPPIKSHRGASSQSGYSSGGQSGIPGPSPAGQGSGDGTPSCSPPPSGSPSTTPSGSPTSSGSPTPTESPTPTGSPSTTAGAPEPSQSAPPGSANTPSNSPSPVQSPASAFDNAQDQPTPTAPATPTPSPMPSPTGTPQPTPTGSPPPPCGS